MSVFERESFAEFIDHIIRLREEAGHPHPAHAPLHSARANDEEAVAALSPAGDAVAIRKALRTLHKEFPYGAALPELSAYFVRGYLGLDPFGDGDQVAWPYLADLLDMDMDRFGDMEAWSERIRQRINDSHPHGFTRRHVLDRDPSFLELAEEFTPLLSGPNAPNQQV